MSVKRIRAGVFAVAAFAWPLSPVPAADRTLSAKVSHIVRTPAAVFYLALPAGARDARLMMRGADGRTRTLLDPGTLAKRLGRPAHVAISDVLPSPDATHVAVGLEPDGAEYQTHTRIIDTQTGKLLADDLPRTWCGASAWSLDGTTLFYNRLPAPAAGDAAALGLRSLVYRHILGSDAMDAAVFGIGVDPNVPFVPADRPQLFVPNGSTYAIGTVATGVQNDRTLYVAPVAAVLAGGQIPWRKFADADDRVTAFDVYGNTAYLVMHTDAVSNTINAVDLADPDSSAVRASTIVPAGAGSIERLAVAGDALYVAGVDAGRVRLRKLPWNADGAAGPIAEVTLPFAGALGEFATDPRADGALLAPESTPNPAIVYRLDANGKLVDIRLLTAPHVDRAGKPSRTSVIAPNFHRSNIATSTPRT